MKLITVLADMLIAHASGSERIPFLKCDNKQRICRRQRELIRIYRLVRLEMLKTQLKSRIMYNQPENVVEWSGRHVGL